MTSSSFDQKSPYTHRFFCALRLLVSLACFLFVRPVSLFAGQLTVVLGLKAVLEHRKLVLLLDYDGTLTPIVNDPSKAVLSERVSSGSNASSNLRGSMRRQWWVLIG